jgi:hypothetical protein
VLSRVTLNNQVMTSSFRQPVLRLSLVPLAACLAAGCRRTAPHEPPVATPSIAINHDRAPAASPIEITYKFVVAGDAHFAENYRVFVHVLDTDEARMWDDDHNPPVPTTQWKPGQTIEYTRTIFVPIFPYVGEATIQVGLHSIRDQKRQVLAGEDAGQRAYKVGRLQLLPQTENLFTVFKDGWHPAEAAADNATIEWQWTKKEATLAFRNPKKDAVFYLELDSPGPGLHGDQQVQVAVGGQVVDQFTMTPTERLFRRIKLSAAQMGTADMAELRIAVDRTFFPAQVTGANSKDPRELGVRVFHAFVDPR